MNDLAVAGVAFVLGGGLVMGMAAWHQRRLRRAVAEERRAAREERGKLLDRQGRLLDDLRFAQDQAASIRADRDLAAARDMAYLDGMRHGAEMGDVERMAYNLDQKQSCRVLRMARYQEGRISG